MTAKEQMAQNYYEILGVPKDAGSNDIKRAFRQIARECHPDVSGGDETAEARFKSARQAYETLMDPVARARYDRRGRRRVMSGGSFFDAFYRQTGEQSGPRKPKPSYGNSDAGGAQGHRKRDPGNNLGLDDLFNDFGFGGGRAKAEGPVYGDPSPEHRPQPGSDVQIELEVPAKIAAVGGSVTAVYYRMQRADAWRPGNADPGLIRVQDIAEVRVIPGTSDGTMLRENGLGNAGAWGGPYGDLHVRVRIVGSAYEPDPEPKGEPSEVEVAISVVEALLGGRIEVDTPQGRVRLSVPAGTSSGARLRLKNKGAEGAGGQPTDLYVRLRIMVPKQLDAQSRRLIEQFAELNPWDPRQG